MGATAIPASEGGHPPYCSLIGRDVAVTGRVLRMGTDDNRRILLRASAVVVLASAPAAAHDTGGLDLDTITIVATGVSAMNAASAGDVNQARILGQPLLRPAAVLESIPGLIVTQHSGEGKANQYFMRAFNLDHGTDLALEVDDMPVNLPTHAHGQGYSDLNFLIPELTADLHYKKGPYYADEGDFATAGTARIALVDTLPASLSLGAGEEGYRRALALGSTELAGGTLLMGGELYRNNGPFEVPDDYRRLNGVARYRRCDRDNYFTLTAMTYSGRWNATDQVPASAVEEGVVDRFGSLNPTDGGNTERSSLSFSHVARTDSVPNSPTSVIDASLTARTPGGWYASVRARHFGESPLVEDANRPGKGSGRVLS